MKLSEHIQTVITSTEKDYNKNMKNLLMQAYEELTPFYKTREEILVAGRVDRQRWTDLLLDYLNLYKGEITQKNIKALIFTSAIHVARKEETELRIAVCLYSLFMFADAVERSNDISGFKDLLAMKRIVRDIEIMGNVENSRAK